MYIYVRCVCAYMCVSMFIHIYIYTSHRQVGHPAPLACYVYVYVPVDICIHKM